MKKKTTTLLTLLLMCVTMMAQTDISKYYLENYGFDSDFDYPASSTQNVAQEIRSIPGWTQDFTMDYTITGVYEFGFGGVFNNGKVPALGYDDEAGGGLALSTGWEEQMKYYQTVTLPAGSYTISVPTYNGYSSTGGSSLLAWIPSSGSSVKSTVTSYPSSKWTLDQISFKLTKTTTGKIQIGYKAAAGGSSGSANLVIDYVQVLATDMAVDKTMLKSTLDSANHYYGDGSGIDSDLLKAAIDAAQAIYDDEEADMVTVLEVNNDLKEAIKNYRKANVSEENPLDCTSYITNPNFEDKTEGWTVVSLVAQSNSSFSRKSGTYYLEKWVSGGSVGDGSVRQTISIPNGVYKLTVAAQNYTQSSTSKKNTGAYIFAGDQQTIVYTPNDYSVTFTSVAGKIDIGFVAEGATGNWIAVDNFRLSLIGYVDDAALIAEVARLVDNAMALQGSQMSASAAKELQDQIDAANLIVNGTNEYSSDVALALQAAIAAAQKSIAEYAALSKEVDVAVSVRDSGSMMNSAVAENLQAQIEAANKILDGTEEYSDAVAKKLQAAIDAAKSSVSDFQALQKALDDAIAIYDPNKEGAESLLAELTVAKDMVEDSETTSESIMIEIEALKTAQLLFLVANGSGNEPTVTTKTDFMIPAAHGGLIRATFESGISYKERGICWSTEKEPTIADNRETAYYSQKGMLFHVQGMEPAKVYYARAYAITSTYAVGYGEVMKVVTLPKGSCVGTWDNGAPDEAANNRCRTAIQQTMDYLNEWTAIKGFTLSGHYGAQTQTADCSYGGWMRIGPNAGNQAIGTVIHETGHGVGVGTHWRWNNCADTRANTTYGKWLGSWANKTLHFLENTTDEAVFMTGDGVHGWGTGPGISYDWFVNGADKDKHVAIQYIGGCALLYSLYVDGLCPTSGHPNGVPGYTFNFDDDQTYCIMCEDAERGLGTGFVYQRAVTALGWKPVEDRAQLTDSVRWVVEYEPSQGYYRFKNVATGKYISHNATAQNMSMKAATKPGATENFQLMPGRKDIYFSIGATKQRHPSYWFTWHDSSTKSMQLNALSELFGYGTASIKAFDYSDKGGKQQRYIIVPSSLVEQLLPEPIVKLKGDVNLDGKVDISDVVAVINTMAGDTTYKATSDVNEDETTDISDIVAIINIMAGTE